MGATTSLANWPRRRWSTCSRRALGCAPEDVQDRVVFSLSGGTEGVVTPHIIVFARGDASPTPGEKRLAVATGATREFTPDEIGRLPQITETARAIRDVVATLGVDSPADVHLVQMKGAIPPFTHADADAAAQAGKPLRCNMVYSRAASALATALALGEIAPDAVSDDSVCRDWSMYSRVASCSAKPGLRHTEILAFAMSSGWGGDLIIDHGVLADILDVDSIRAVAARLGLADGSMERLVGVFAKSEADPRGTVRGRRHTMLDDDDISDTRYSRLRPRLSPRCHSRRPACLRLDSRRTPRPPRRRATRHHRPSPDVTARSPSSPAATHQIASLVRRALTGERSVPTRHGSARIRHRRHTAGVPTGTVLDVRQAHQWLHQPNERAATDREHRRGQDGKDPSPRDLSALVQALGEPGEQD